MSDAQQHTSSRFFCLGISVELHVCVRDKAHVDEYAAAAAALKSNEFFFWFFSSKHTRRRLHFFASSLRIRASSSQYLPNTLQIVGISVILRDIEVNAQFSRFFFATKWKIKVSFEIYIELRIWLLILHTFIFTHTEEKALAYTQ